VIVLALIVAALLLFIAWREHETAKERTHLIHLLTLSTPEVVAIERAAAKKATEKKPAPVVLEGGI
jgi:hypothetical protein